MMKIMKRFIGVSTTFVLLLVLSGCFNFIDYIDKIYDKDIKVLVTGYNTVKVDESITLQLEFSRPFEGDVEAISKDENILTVELIDEYQFLVTGKSVGRGVITFKYANRSFSFVVEVTKKTITDLDLAFVNSLLSTLTLEEKIGQMFIVGFPGATVPATTLANINQYKFGNYIYMLDNTESPQGVIDLTTSLQNNIVGLTSIPAFISIDQEGGMVEKFLSGATHFLGNMAIAATNNPNNAYLVGQSVGIELRNYGINVDFAPVLDVNNNPLNPIIGVRSYSDNADMVSAFGNKMIQGLKETNVMATAKHFPGHGDTSVDSHYGLPTITHGMERLFEVELAPYISAMANGLDAIMTTHIIFSAIDADYPATLSKKVLTGLLREQLGFDGLIITDGMGMNAIRDHFGYAEAGVLAVLAGVDILTFTDSTNISIQAYNGILEAVQDGRIPIAKIDEAVRRILIKKVEYNLFREYLPREYALTYDLSLHQALNEKLSEESITVVKGGFSGLDKTKSTLIISTRALRYTLAPGLTGDFNSLAYLASIKLKEKGFTTVDYRVIGTSLNSTTINNLVNLAKTYDQVIFAGENISVSQGNLVKALYNDNNNTIAISLNRPYDINRYLEIEHYICAYEYTPASVNVLIKLFNSEFIPTGIIPIDLNLE